VLASERRHKFSRLQLTRRVLSSEGAVDPLTRSRAAKPGTCERMRLIWNLLGCR